MPQLSDPANKRRSSSSLLVRLVSLVLVAVYIWVIEWAWGWATIVDQWRNWSALQLSAIVLAILATYLIRAMRIWDYFRHQAGVHLLSCFKLTLLHNLANNILPMRSGEASFPLLMKSYFQLSISLTTGTLLWFRFLDLLVLLLLGAAAWLSLTGQPAWLWPLWLIVALTPVLILPMQPLLRRHLTSRLPGKIRNLAEALLSGAPTRWSPLLRSLGFTWMNWALKMAVFAMVVLSFTSLTPLNAFIGALGGELSSILPIHAPAGLGTYEAGVVAGAAVGGGDPKDALQGGVNLHILLILCTLVGGLLALALPGRRASQELGQD